MKKAILAIMVLGLCFGLATSAMAQVTGDTTVTVTVNSIEDLTVPTTVAITLGTVDTGDPSNYVTGTADAGGQLTYSHNSTTNKKITATAVAGGSNATNDITLKVTVDGTTGAKEVVTSGTPAASAVDVWTDIAAGSYTKDLTWTAGGSLAKTKVGSYTWTVTFTSADAT